MNVDDAAQAILEMDDRNRKLFEFRRSQPYDGVLGSLPSWVPEPIQKRFEDTRNMVLDKWRYLPNDALGWLNCYESDDPLIEPARYPNGLELDPDYFSETIGFLTHLRWVMTLAPEHGMEYLGGSLAQRGYRNSENLQPRSLDVLSRLLDKIYLGLYMELKRPPTNKQMIEALKDQAENGSNIVQEIDEEAEKIYWKSLQKEKDPLRFRQFNERMTGVRKRFKKQL